MDLGLGERHREPQNVPAAPIPMAETLRHRAQRRHGGLFRSAHPGSGISSGAGCCTNFPPLPLSIPPGNSFSSFNIELMQRLCRLQATISPSRGMDPAARAATERRWSGRFHFKVEHYLRRRSRDFPSVEPILYLLNIFVAYRAKVRALREVLPHQAVGVLIQAALPGMERRRRNLRQVRHACGLRTPCRCDCVDQ